MLLWPRKESGRDLTWAVGSWRWPLGCFWVLQMAGRGIFPVSRNCWMFYTVGILLYYSRASLLCFCAINYVLVRNLRRSPSLKYIRNFSKNFVFIAINAMRNETSRFHLRWNIERFLWFQYSLDESVPAHFMDSSVLIYLFIYFRGMESILFYGTAIKLTMQ